MFNYIFNKNYIASNCKITMHATFDNVVLKLWKGVTRGPILERQEGIKVNIEIYRKNVQTSSSQKQELQCYNFLYYYASTKN